MAAAIKILSKVAKKHADDADTWYYLGLAYNSEGAIVLARTALERFLRLRPGLDKLADAEAKLAYGYVLANELEHATALARSAINLRYQSAEAHYAIAEANLRIGEVTKALEEADVSLQIQQNFAPALLTKSLAHYSLKQYAESAAALERFLAANPNDPDEDVWREQLRQMHDSAQVGSSATSEAVTSLSKDVLVASKEVTVRGRILSKPEPTYTEAARSAGVTGMVVIKCIFASDGEVRNLVVTRALGYGLTSRAVRAARSIRFTPAMKDNKQVSMYMQLEYNFNLY